MEKTKKKSILLVDDDTSLLVTLSDFLRFEGYRVVTADSGEQALKKLAAANPDLIILDMSMPGMGGVGFLKEISSPEGKPTYPVLVLTARANMAEFFANVDVDGFVSKPCDPDDLLMEVGRIIFLRSGNEGQEEQGGAVEKKKVLIGEDDSSANEELVRVFTERGYGVEGVFKGPEVLERAIVGRPDVIVMKLILASMNGDAVANMLKEMPNTRDIPVVLYGVGGSHGSTVRQARRGVAPRRLVKESSPAAILTVVEDVLSR